MKKRHANGGLRKACDCSRRAWAKCAHSWHLNFKPRGGPSYRLALDKYFTRHIDSKSEAEELAADLRKLMRAGTFGQPTPVLDRLTVAHLLDTYKKRYVAVERKDSVTNVGYQIALITRTEIEHPDNRRQPFGEWLVADVTADALDRFKETRLTRGTAAANRDLALLRAAFNWGIRTKHVKETPFKLGTETVVKLSKEHARSRRLEPGEDERLLGACAPHLRAIVEAALETGMRRGEILSLQWSQVEGLMIDGHEGSPQQTVTWAPKAALFLPARKTKTKKERRIPISARLKTILEMRRFDPKGDAHPADAFVFGTEIGGRVLGFGRAWETAVLKSHGHEPTYTKTANLAPTSRAALKAIDLHFHDLRREAGSRWLDGGMPLHVIRELLGHSNISQTSTYLATTTASLHDAMQQFEIQRGSRPETLQPRATEDGTGERKRPQSATAENTTPRKDADEHEPTIM